MKNETSPSNQGAAFHRIRSLRDRHQGDWCARAAGAWRQGGPVRRCIRFRISRRPSCSRASGRARGFIQP